MNHLPESDEPPPASAPGGMAARLARFQHEHPALYASRHVALATLKALLPLLGLGALVAALLAWLDWSWLQETAAVVRSRLPDLPFFDRPDQPPWFAETRWFGWIKWAVRQAKWLVPIVIALCVAVEEIERRKRRERQTDNLEPAARRSDTHQTRSE